MIANQEREKAGLENPVVHDTDMAIRVAVVRDPQIDFRRTEKRVECI